MGRLGTAIMTQQSDTVTAVTRHSDTVMVTRSEKGGAVTCGRRRMRPDPPDVSIPQNACCTVHNLCMSYNRVRELYKQYAEVAKVLLLFLKTYNIFNFYLHVLTSVMGSFLVLMVAKKVTRTPTKIIWPLFCSIQDINFIIFGSHCIVIQFQTSGDIENGSFNIIKSEDLDPIGAISRKRFRFRCTSIQSNCKADLEKHKITSKPWVN
jgi:hypothetical protein